MGQKEPEKFDMYLKRHIVKKHSGRPHVRRKKGIKSHAATSMKPMPVSYIM